MLRVSKHQGRFYETETHVLTPTLQKFTPGIPGVHAQLRLSSIRRLERQLQIKVSKQARRDDTRL
jgi:hypothetical protein